MPKQASDRSRRRDSPGLRAVDPEPPETAAVDGSSGIAYLIDVIQDLKRDNQRYRALLDSLPVGVAISEAEPPEPPGEAKILYASEAMAQITGYPAGELLGAGERRLLGPVSDAEASQAQAAARRERRPTCAEITLHRKDGTPFPAALTGSPVFDDLGELESVLTLIADRSEAAEIERLRAALRAAQSNGADATFQLTANLIHELRTPLNAIIGFADVLQSEVFGPLPHPKCREYVEDIMASGKHLLELVNEILDLSKADVGRLELNEGEVDLAAAIRASTKMIEQTAKYARIELTVALAPDLPRLRADERRLRQILINLLANAVKFTPSGGEILLTADRDPEAGLFISVMDTGIGISEEDLPVAMAPFGQVEAGGRGEAQGTGLGLPLTKKLLQVHGGSLEVLSSIGQGTIMVAHFPAERVIEEGRTLTPP